MGLKSARPRSLSQDFTFLFELDLADSGHYRLTPTAKKIIDDLPNFLSFEDIFACRNNAEPYPYSR